jgi:hypothetical protein
LILNTKIKRLEKESRELRREKKWTQILKKQ